MLHLLLLLFLYNRNRRQEPLVLHHYPHVGGYHPLRPCRCPPSQEIPPPPPCPYPPYQAATPLQRGCQTRVPHLTGHHLPHQRKTSSCSIHLLPIHRFQGVIATTPHHVQAASTLEDQACATSYTSPNPPPPPPSPTLTPPSHHQSLQNWLHHQVHQAASQRH